MNITSLASKYFLFRQKQLELHYSKPEELQHNVFKALISKGSNTEYGKKYNYSSINSFESYQKFVPVNTYDSLKSYIMRMKNGESNVLWHGKTTSFAKSSGTTNDKSKFIPVTKDGLKSIHYAGGRDAIAIYLMNNPKSKIFDGKGLILGGSKDMQSSTSQNYCGDLSAILIQNINPLINFVRTPSKNIALLSDFEEKRDAIVNQTLAQNVTNLSGVPSWMLSVLVKVLENSGKKHIEDVWQNIEVFFHGGISFTPYRKQYEQIITKPDMNYMETYNASEGFFGLQDNPLTHDMLLMLDYDVFYEFIPISELNKETPNVVPLEGVEVGKNYAMLITTSCGMWRYLIGDTVKFTSKKPYKFIITGRTKSFINAFGEELIVDNTDKALFETCKKTGAQIIDYTAAPIFMNSNAQCKHQWLIEFSKRPSDILEFQKILDTEIQSLNSDYEAKRHKNITLQELEIVVARTNLFNDWLKEKGKLGGQHKVPRLNNERKIIDELLQLNTSDNTQQ